MIERLNPDPSRQRPLPFFLWEREQRARRAWRRRLRSRSAAVAIAIACLMGTIALPPLPRLVWNASPSSPMGLYVVAPGGAVARGEMVIAQPPAEIRNLAARRRYLPVNVPLVKRVAAVAGDRVCADGAIVTINGRPVAIRRSSDGAGRPLPRWQGCRQLDSGAVFLMMADRLDSFDGRYFGISALTDVIGRATPLWLR